MSTLFEAIKKADEKQYDVTIAGRRDVVMIQLHAHPHKSNQIFKFKKWDEKAIAKKVLDYLSDDEYE